ncbi:MAG TPA: CHAD domain-containing protein [Vicinamibacterales bacterium]|jgi:CHAD domain-containing protein|nr:CHAD domain-containing protein [Vicinamibacterales bacterium]
MNRSPVLIRLLDRRTRALKRHIPRAIAGDDVGVHQARVASRRLREAVPVLSEGLHGSKAGKAQRKIRKLTQALGTVRELDVALGLIDELDARQEVPKAALADVRAHVMSEREDRRRVMHERLEDVNREKLERRLQSVRDALAAPSPDHAWRSALAHRLVTGARRLDHAITKAGQIYAPEALHQVRIASKKLRYALEIADESRAARCTADLRLMKRVQDALGRLHDLQVLQHHVAELDAAPISRRAAGDPGLAVLARVIEDDCRMLHARYVALMPALQEAATRIRREIAVRVTAPRRRPAKMLLAARRRTAGAAP